MLWTRPFLRRPLFSTTSISLLTPARLASSVPPPISNNAPVQLRPYQETCLSVCTSKLAQGVTRIGVSLPTGSGKTVVFVSLISRLRPPKENPDATRTLIIVNSVELARQSASQASRLFPDWTVEIEQGVKHKASGLADVTVATYQTLLQGERLAKFNPRGFKAVIVDEAHHAAAPSYRRILSHFDPEIRSPDNDGETEPSATLPSKIPIIGFSATFSRHDGLALGSVFSEIVYHRDFLEMIKEEWLCPVKFTTVKADIDLRGVTVNSRTGDFNATSLAQVIDTPMINQLVVQAWHDRAKERKSTLVFCVNVAHVRNLTQMFAAFEVDARYVYAGTPLQERKQLIQDFRDGKFPVLINCAILTEGADIPNIDCVVLARPTRSKNVFAQMIGRGMRLSANTGKTDCHIIDFVESNTRVSGIISTPTLFGLDPGDVDITNECLESLEQRVNEAAPPLTEDDPPKSLLSTHSEIPAPTGISYIDYDDPEVLARDGFGEGGAGQMHITRLSRNAWVPCAEGTFVLECLGKGHIKIERVKPTTEEEKGEADDEGCVYRAVYTPAPMDFATSRALKMPPTYLRKRQILTARTLNEAILGADTYAGKKVVHGPMVAGLLRSANWRRFAASKQQLEFIARRLNKAGDPEKQKKIDKMNKGDASTVICRLKHGAQTKMEKKQREAMRADAVKQKEAC